jgi:hypothetical protein
MAGIGRQKKPGKTLPCQEKTCTGESRAGGVLKSKTEAHGQGR